MPKLSKQKIVLYRRPPPPCNQRRKTDQGGGVAQRLQSARPPVGQRRVGFRKPQFSEPVERLYGGSRQCRPWPSLGPSSGAKCQEGARDLIPIVGDFFHDFLVSVLIFPSLSSFYHRSHKQVVFILVHFSTSLVHVKSLNLQTSF